MVVINGSRLPGAPYPAGSGQKIFGYLTGHQGQLQASAVLAGLAAIAVLAACTLADPGEVRRGE